MCPASGCDRLIWRALTDAGFRQRLLTGDRRQVVAGFDLTAEEREVLESVQVASLCDLAQALVACGVGGCRSGASAWDERAPARDGDSSKEGKRRGR